MFNIPGASWPYNLNLRQEELEKLKDIYFDYKINSISNFGRVCALKPHLLSEKVYKLASRKEILKEVERIIGKDINIWSSAFFVKEPNNKKYVGFHQDSPYWQLSSSKVVTAWIALSDSIKDNGCLQFIESASEDSKSIHPLDVVDAYSTYKEGLKTTKNEDLISYNQLIPKKYLENKRYFVELKSGEFSIHDISVIHGSDKNVSNQYRIGLAVRYIDSNTFHLKDKKDTALNIQGKKSNYLNNETIPVGEFSNSNIMSYNLFIKSAGGFGNKSY